MYSEAFTVAYPSTLLHWSHLPAVWHTFACIYTRYTLHKSDLICGLVWESIKPVFSYSSFLVFLILLPLPHTQQATMNRLHLMRCKMTDEIQGAQMKDKLECICVFVCAIMHEYPRVFYHVCSFTTCNVTVICVAVLSYVGELMCVCMCVCLCSKKKP